MARVAQDRGLRHAFGVRVRLPLAAHRGDDAAAGTHLSGNHHRRALSTRRELPHLGGICRALQDGIEGVGAGDCGGRMMPAFWTDPDRPDAEERTQCASRSTARPRPWVYPKVGTISEQVGYSRLAVLRDAAFSRSSG